MSRIVINDLLYTASGGDPENLIPSLSQIRDITRQPTVFGLDASTGVSVRATGVGFQYDPLGLPRFAQRVDTLTVSVNGQVAASVTEINASNVELNGLDEDAAIAIALRGDDTVIGSSFGDQLTLLGGNDAFDGRGGLDVATYRGPRSGYTVTSSGPTLTVADRTSGRDGTDTLTNVERLEFADGVLAFDLTGNAGTTYRLYQAAFDRVPDLAGLTNNVRLADGGLSLRGLADAFVNSAEFRTLYGANSSDTTFVTALYRNVLDRAPDQAGLNGWLAALSSGQQDRAGVLIGFSESPENKALVANAIQNGILLDLSVLA